MNLFRREVKRNFTGFVVWSVSLCFYIALTMSMFPSAAKNDASLNQFMKQLPNSMTKAFKLDNISFSNILSYFNINIGILLVLSVGIYAMLLGCGMLSKELDDKTIEFLQAKPITRSSITTEKILCYTLYTFMINVVMFIATYISFQFFKTKSYSLKTLLLVYVGFFLVEFTFANLGLLVSLFVKKKKASTNISLGVVLGMYCLYTLSGISDKFAFIKYLTPFKYADASDVIANGYINSINIVILIIVNVVAVALAYFVYNRKDIPT